MRLWTHLVSLALVLSALIPASNSTVDAAPRRPISRQSCAYQNSALNGRDVLYGDDKAYYWGSTYLMQDVANTSLRIYGEYPKARYMSVHGYDDQGRPVDGLFDAQIAPDPGSANPFLDGASRNPTFRNWSVTIRFTPPTATPEPNTLYLGLDADGVPNTEKISWVYRIYYPDQGEDLQGGVIVPRVTAINANGRASCPPFGDLTLSPGNFLGPAQTDPISWKLFAVDTTISNPDIGYVVSTINLNNPAFGGRLLVIRFRRPTFSDTFNGGLINSALNMRYLSMSLNGIDGRPDVSKADSELLVDGNGVARIVVSTLANKPSDTVLATQNAVWMDASNLFLSFGSLVLRNLLPNSGFAQSVLNLGENDTPAQVKQKMGVYYPEGVYCTLTQFNSNGCASIFPAAQSAQQSPRQAERESSSQTSAEPSPTPTLRPTVQPTAQPTLQPTAPPTLQPSAQPTGSPPLMPAPRPPSRR